MTKKKDTSNIETFFGIIGLLVISSGLMIWIPEHRTLIVSLSLISFTIVILGASAESNKKNFIFKTKNDARKYILTETDKHKNVLHAKKSALITKNEYGDVSEIKWEKELQKFYTRCLNNFFEERQLLVKKMNSMDIDINEIAPALTQSNFDELLDGYQKKDEQINNPSSTNLTQMTGVEFEEFIADKLRENGWGVHETPTTGDQGVDLIASKDHLRYGIQCKRFASSVGNKAVQEIISGCKFHDLEYGAVVTNSHFTNSAISLAQKAGVVLISGNDILRIDERLNSSIKKIK